MAVLVNPTQRIAALTDTSIIYNSLDGYINLWKDIFALFSFISLTIYGNASFRNGFGTEIAPCVPVFLILVWFGWQSCYKENKSRVLSRRENVGWLKTFRWFTLQVEKEQWKFCWLWNLAQTDSLTKHIWLAVFRNVIASFCTLSAKTFNVAEVLF